MPHQCTECGTVFEDGSTEMLSGCPECGGNTFQYHPGDATDVAEPASDPEPPERPEPDDSVARSVGNAARTVKNFIGSDDPAPGVDPAEADPLSSWPSETEDEATADGNTSPPARPETGGTAVGGTESDGVTAETPNSNRGETVRTAGIEGEAQASARSAVVSPDELPDSVRSANVAVGSSGNNAENGSDESSTDHRTATEDRPDLSELREELNDQFESIRIVEPGQYELNLMELYEREEYIIALQEDGRYQIQVPETWQD
ncbi:MAG: Zn-ribbon domain-containing protein [Halorhabdus sp.]